MEFKKKNYWCLSRQGIERIKCEVVVEKWESEVTGEVVMLEWGKFR